NAVPTVENKTGETLKAKDGYVDAEGKGVSSKDCVIAGYITEITSATYGNGWMYTTDDVKVQLYGLYDLNGSVNGFRYDKMTTKPGVGDYVIIKGEMVNYNGPEIKNAAILQINDTKCVATPATALALPETFSIDCGSKIDLNKSLIRTPADGVATITWESGNTAVATVSNKGEVTGVTAGTAVITGSAEGIGNFTTTVTVKEDLSKSVAKFEKANTGSLDKTTGGTISGTNGVTWTFSGLPSTANGETVYKNDTDFAMGSGSKPVNGAVTFTATVTQKVKEVIVNAKFASGGDAKVSVKLGDAVVLAETTMSTSYADYKGTVATPAAGTIVVTMSNTVKQMSITSITVVFDIAE
ncbi:MAG: Ig-like domain-containing protein, partial [Clostridia bacterium]|nr:Ig-like domain-containing protein [Clostridia bacterium]